MAFYLKTFPCVDINAFPAIHIHKFESPQSFDFHSLLILQGLFYQEKNSLTNASASFWSCYV